jgi:glycosyltransferase involved in cell wall biosynthesis
MMPFADASTTPSPSLRRAEPSRIPGRAAAEALKAMRRILILQTLPRPLVFSPNNALLTLARHLDRRRYEMTVAVPRAGLLTEALSREGVQVARVLGLRTYRRHDAIWRLPVVSLRVAALARKCGARLLLANHAELGPFAHAAARLCGIPWICFLRQADRSSRYYEKYRLARADGVGAVSEAALEGYRRYLRETGLTPRALAAVPTGLDLPPVPAGLRAEFPLPPGWSRDSRIVGTVGLREVKRPAMLLEILARVIPGLPEARCLLVGALDGIQRKELESLARQKEIAESIHFAGQQREMSPVYGAMHVYAHTSRSEGFPKAALEAMSHGLPVIAFRVGGIPEAVVDGETGFLCAPDDVEEFAAHLRHLLAHPDQARALGDSGRLRVRQRFSPEAMVHGMMDLFDRVQDESPRGGTRSDGRAREASGPAARD